MPTFMDLNRTPAFIRNPDFQGVAPGARATARIPVGSTLLTSFLEFKKGAGPLVAMSEAEIIADVAEVRLTIDAETKLQFTGAQIVALVKFYGQTIANGILPLNWARPWMGDIGNQDAPAYGLAEANSANIEVQFVAGSITTSLVLTHENVAGEPLGTHVVYLRQGYNFSATGVQEITDIPRDPLYGLFAMHIQQSDTILDRIEILADNIQLLDANPNTLKARYGRYTPQRVPQTGFTHLDFAYRGRGADVLPLNMQDLRVRLTWNTAPVGSLVNILYEQVRVAPSKGKPA